MAATRCWAAVLLDPGRPTVGNSTILPTVWAAVGRSAAAEPARVAPAPSMRSRCWAIVSSAIVLGPSGWWLEAPLSVATRRRFATREYRRPAPAALDVSGPQTCFSGRSSCSSGSAQSEQLQAIRTRCAARLSAISVFPFPPACARSRSASSDRQERLGEARNLGPGMIAPSSGDERAAQCRGRRSPTTSIRCGSRPAAPASGTGRASATSGAGSEYRPRCGSDRSHSERRLSFELGMRSIILKSRSGGAHCPCPSRGRGYP